jgi:hypothetical protein
MKVHEILPFHQRRRLAAYGSQDYRHQGFVSHSQLRTDSFFRLCLYLTILPFVLLTIVSMRRFVRPINPATSGALDTDLYVRWTVEVLIY